MKHGLNMLDNDGNRICRETHKARLSPLFVSFSFSLSFYLSIDIQVQFSALVQDVYMIMNSGMMCKSTASLIQCPQICGLFSLFIFLSFFHHYAFFHGCDIAYLPVRTRSPWWWGVHATAWHQHSRDWLLVWLTAKPASLQVPMCCALKRVHTLLFVAL